MQKKIYCTKCGREIQEGLLYCDRCGQSVKKSIEKQTPKKNLQLEEIHRERLNRKKVQRAKEIKKAVHRKKAAKTNRIIAIVVLLLILALISAVIAYISVLNSSPIIDGTAGATEAPGITPTQSSNVNIVTTEDSGKDKDKDKDKDKSSDETAAPASESFKTYTDSATGLACPYPSDFTPTAPQDGEAIRANDIGGGALVTIAGAEAGSAPDMMLDYISEIGAATSDISLNRAGTNWYVVTAEVNAKIMHRKLVIKNGSALCYDFVYDASSTSAAKYAEYISQMDELFVP